MMTKKGFLYLIVLALTLMLAFSVAAQPLVGDLLLYYDEERELPASQPTIRQLEKNLNSPLWVI